jgi:type VI secretion system secreted protein VgrG
VAESYSTGTDSDAEEGYSNQFTCIPAKVTFRPPRVSPKPTVQGAQTAIVAGKAGEEIWTDKYGRVKVQFHWDRRGESNERSSCWIRVAQPLAGKGWGAICLPRIGQEVIVDFLEGDPDRPIITGTVYNAVQTPPYELPKEKTKITLKSNSSKGGGGFNELRFEDKKGHEQVFMHAERDFDLRIKADRRELVGHDRHLIVRRDRLEQVDRDAHACVNRDRIQYVDRDDHLGIGGKQAIEILKSQSLRVDGDVNQEFGANASTVVAGSSYLQATNVVLEALGGLTIKSGANFISINAAGVQISGAQVLINSGGSALSGTAGMLMDPRPPLWPEIADNADPGSEVRCFRHQRLEREAQAPGSLAADAAPTYNPKAPENKNKKSWIEIELKDEDGNPVPGERYRITLPDGSVYEGTLDEKGLARVDHIDPGTCQITFPELDEDVWEPR